MTERLLKRKLIIGLGIFLILSIGLINLYQLPRREIPIIQHPIGIITTYYPGATASQVESYISNKLEKSISEIPGIEKVTSLSQAGLSQITITVDDYKKQDKVWDKMQQKINQLQSDLPDEASTPSLHTDLQMQGVAIYQLVAEQEEDLLLIEDWLDKWEKVFKQVPGVVKVQIQGLDERELLLQVDPDKMAAFKLSPTQLSSIIQKEINPVPTGQWNMENRVYRMHLLLIDPQSLLQIPVATGRSGNDIQLKDIATIEKVYPQDREIVTFQGNSSVSLSFFASNEKDLLKIDGQLCDLLKKMELELPPKIKIVQVYTQAEPIKNKFYRCIHHNGTDFYSRISFLLRTACTE